jgi:hypothetical protein
MGIQVFKARSLSRVALRRPLRLSRDARWEVLGLATLFALVAMGYLYRLGSVIVPNMDEGTYLYASKLIADGQVPYRDFYLAHPPLMMYFFALPTKIFGPDVMAARFVNMAFVFLSMVPLYLIVRDLSGKAAALFATSLYVVGMLALANTARTIRLEPFMNAFVICALALYFWRPDDQRARFGVGMLFAAAVMVKLVAVLPFGLLFVGDFLLVRPPLNRFLRSWAITFAGCIPVLIVLAFALTGVTGFFHDVVVSQVDRPPVPMELRIANLRSAFERFPAIPLALVAGVWLLFRGSDPKLKLLSLMAIGQTALLAFAFKSSINYYYIQVLPQVVIITAFVATSGVRTLTPRMFYPAFVAASLFLAAAVPLAYAVIYDEQRVQHTSSAAAVLDLLREGDGYIYSMAPSFSLWSGRDLYPWRYEIDSFLPRGTGQNRESDFIDVFRGSEALVFWPYELDFMPLAKAYVQQDFHQVLNNGDWELWLRNSPSLQAGSQQ